MRCSFIVIVHQIRKLVIQSRGAYHQIKTGAVQRRAPVFICSVPYIVGINCLSLILWILFFLNLSPQVIVLRITNFIQHTKYFLHICKYKNYEKSENVKWCFHEQCPLHRNQYTPAIKENVY